MKNKDIINSTPKPIVHPYSPNTTVTNSMTPVPAPQPGTSRQPAVIVPHEKK